MAASTTLTTARTTAAGWVRTGIIGGAVAGAAFAMAEMAAAAALNGAGAFFMPLRMIAGIVLGPSAMAASTPFAAAGAVGLVVHMALSMVYGVAVAAVIAAVPALRRSALTVTAAASAAGFGLWVVNFLLLAGVFGWPWFPDGQNVVVQVAAHTVMFGTVLGLLLERFAFRSAR